MSEFRGRSSRGRGSRGRGGPPRGGPRGGGRGSYSSERDGGRGGYRGRGDGFSRGRGGPRHFSRDDDSPPRKIPMMSRGYDSDRGRGPPMGRRDRYEDSYDRGAPSRSRDSFSSPPRDSSRILDRLSPPRSSLRDRDFITSSRGDYLPPRSYSPPRDSGAYRESYTTSLREDRRDSFSRPAVRDYSAPRIDYAGDRGRDLRDSPRDFGSPRDYPPPRSADFREPLSRDFLPRDREYSSRSLSSRLDDRMSSRGPPREYRGRGGSRGMHGGRDDRGGRGGRGGYMNENAEVSKESLPSQVSDSLQNTESTTQEEEDNVFLMICHKKTTIFTDVPENTSIAEVKRILEGILKVPPDNMILFNKDIAMYHDNYSLLDYGYTVAEAKAHSPGIIDLVFTTEE
ncbi:RNA-binding motif protein, X chromosome-like isoform X2 [Physella acuta]|uniref:RNA-binding motif protein, X chromosome-like isoform X2 n=1 Tax=Physella acuta TaxID=109671 RepID=UPI0027DCFCDA|nr:RNA-binding motif protein, X chromosome-like isoform X2 [Physella acuta]